MGSCLRSTDSNLDGLPHANDHDDAHVNDANANDDDVRANVHDHDYDHVHDHDDCDCQHNTPKQR